jgi:hypothetical protein
MGKRGPNPVDLSRLKTEAARWTDFFFTLRDGQDGAFYLFEPLPEKRTEVQEEVGMTHRLRRVAIVPVSTRLVVEEVKERNRRLSPNGLFVPPIYPATEAWERMKRARTAAEMKMAARAVRRWESEWAKGIPQEMLGAPAEWRTGPHYYAKAIRTNADTLMRAKRLPHYPSDPASNDDKRIAFFAKVLAGLTLGLAPLTATKRLSRWRWPHELAKGELRELARQYPMPGGNRAKGREK